MGGVGGSHRCAAGNTEGMVFARSACGLHDRACQTFQGWLLVVLLVAGVALFAFYRWKMRSGGVVPPSTAVESRDREGDRPRAASVPRSPAVPAERPDVRRVVVRVAAGVAGLAVWIVGILELGAGREVAGSLEVILGGVMMSLALWQRVPNFLGVLWHLLSR